jgi:hypothetical protein
MTSNTSHPHKGSAASDLGSRLRCDVTWGRFLFQPPELTNPHVVFDPLPFRAHEYAGAPRARKAPYTR